MVSSVVCISAGRVVFQDLTKDSQDDFCMSLCACSEAEVYVTRTPPNATVVGGPSGGTASPSTVTFSFASQVSGSGAGAPIAYSLCLLQDVDNSQVRHPLWICGCPVWLFLLVIV